LEATEQIQLSMDSGSIKKSDILSFLATASESARLIMTNVDRAAHLITSFKQIAVDQTNELRRPFKLKEYIDEVIMSLHPKLKHRAIQIKVMHMNRKVAARFISMQYNVTTTSKLISRTTGSASRMNT
jgi:two-component system NtrC family sensor kinase